MTFKSLYITDKMRHNIYLKQDFTCGAYFSMIILSPCFKKTYENYAFSEVHQWLFYIVSKLHYGNQIANDFDDRS